MTDLQTPIQDSNAQNPTSDLLGDISISLPTAPNDAAATNASDLGNISVASNGAVPADISADIAAISIPAAPAEEQTAPEATPQPVVTEAPTTTETILPMENVATPATEAQPTNDIEAISVELPTETPAPQEIVADTTSVSPIPTTETTTTEEIVIQAAPTEISQPTQEEPALDLDALTNDITIPVTNNEEAPTPSIASVNLPQATVVNTQIGAIHSKKKTVVMALLLLMLLAVGGFVFRTMMPDESDKLLANVMGLFGGSSAQPTIIPVVSTPVSTGSTTTTT